MKNWSRPINFVILLCLGFFLIPSIAFACAKKTTQTEQESCPKEQSSKAEKKDCCKKGNDHKGCDSKCKHSSCSCSTSLSFLGLPITTDLKSKKHFTALKKQKFGFKQAGYSSGYLFIWQPPKIS